MVFKQSLALLHELARHADVAIATFKQCIELVGAPVEQVAQALVSLAGMHWETGDKEKAITDLTQCIELVGAPVEQVAQALVSLAGMHWETGDKEKAITDLTQCIELVGAPVEQVADAWNHLAWLGYEASRDSQHTQGFVVRGESVDAVTAARYACEYGNLEAHKPAHTLACLLALRNDWSEAWTLASLFCPADAEVLRECAFDDLIEFFQHAVRQGQVTEAVEFMEKQRQQERLRPLYEALRAEQAGTYDYLLRVAPEVRIPAEEALFRLGSKLFPSRP